MRTHARLTALTLKRLLRERKPGLTADGGNLYLQDGSGWQLIYERDGVRRYMGLGPARDVSLAEARQAASDARRLLREGQDPLAARRASRASQKAAMSFQEFAEKHVAAHAPGWRGGKSEEQWRSSLAAHVYPVIGNMAIGAVDLDDVLRVLTPIWAAKAVTAGRVRGRIETILDAAKSRDLRTGENPARWKGHLENLLPRVTKARAVRHYAAAPYADIPTLVAKLRRVESVKSMALEFLILTATRSGEVLGARWAELDATQRLWVIPSERMKSGREHRVPLTGRALGIIEKMGAVRSGAFLFPGQRPGGPLGEMALARALRSTGHAGATVHGMRSAFRDWAGDNGVTRELAETALAHSVGDQTERSYRRSDAIERRRTLMDAWGAFLDQPAAGGKVLHLRSTA
jgi:integrase